MTTPHDGHDHHEHAAPELPYSDADIAGFRQEDIHAGKMVVLEMTGIFMVGIIIYVLVMLSTWPAVINS